MKLRGRISPNETEGPNLSYSHRIVVVCLVLVSLSIFLSLLILLSSGEEESEEEEFGNVHIIELHKAEEPLGIHLTHFTGPDGT